LLCCFRLHAYNIVDATPPSEQNGLISGAAQMNGSNQVKYALSHACNTGARRDGQVARSQSRLPGAYNNTAAEALCMVIIR